MLSYAFTGLRLKEYTNLSTEDFDNIYDLFSEILILGLNKQIKQGLFKDYIEVNETTSSIKGKINITESINDLTMLQAKLNCTYDEFSINSYPNRIIRTTLFYLLKAEVSSDRKKKLKRLLYYFESVDMLDVNNINWKIRYDRNNQSYRLLISICNLVIEGLIYSDEKGNKKLLEFLDDSLMHALYERFLLNYYIKEHDITAHSPQVQWQLDNEENYLLPTMQTDVTLEKDGRVLIIDAKYYSRILSGTGNVRSAHLYQIFAYVKNRSLDSYNVSGMLLYAGTRGEIQPNVEYEMSGNRIAIKTLDLYCDFSEIRSQLDGIVEEYFD